MVEVAMVEVAMVEVAMVERLEEGVFPSAGGPLAGARSAWVAGAPLAVARSAWVGERLAAGAWASEVAVSISARSGVVSGVVEVLGEVLSEDSAWAAATADPTL